VPATSGLALLDGMPPVDCDLTDQYGMVRYRRRTKPQSPTETTAAALCAKARVKGFSRVIVLDETTSGGIAVRPVECGAPQA